MKTLALFAVTAAAMAAFRPVAAPPPPRDYAYKVDPVHSSLAFRIKHANASWFYGTFAVQGGGLTIDSGNLAASKVEVVVDAGSIATQDEKRNSHLRGPDYLDARQFPTVTFVSTKLRQEGDAFVVDGDLTLRGVTKPVSATVRKTGASETMGKRVGYETSFSIKRSDFGMDNGLTGNLLGDEVTLMLGLAAVADGK